ncbi:MAG TPA: transcriptional regulator [Microbacterium sp.]|uniref:GAF domain-containing protein n=1 Tax=unclassified Microbacterium TaxID=2609290 RepID=UPI000C4DCE9E|nr:MULTISPECIES: helix-turn-helix domain-containing protein [unclassified Microbacterium]MEE2814452.1 GAF domain-containing protein [Actinomycetota bacterium]MBU19725.1 transcriptional regulator [Microbacterium sp.]HBS07262.1 transcriptional regulator [Microbacterium sp.]HBU41719.1 transcriptional regulator [Microbacterium sp.]HCM50665.1 transcriptional regulator [Microbacterium sp.]|tara:strand:- start:3074 stop:4438 length:1365 start_codon:yes stop_codon:yes gene_type:complete
MPSPWSPGSGTTPDASRLIIERAREEFVLGNDTDARVGDVRGVVRESWRRSRDGRVGVEGLPPLALSAEELELLRAQHPLGSVMDMIRGLLIPGAAEESGVIVAIGDAAGRLLWVEGDRTLRSLTGDMGFVPGADWSEKAVGTAAPGTALALDRSVQIRGAEHFNRLVQPWSCTAAPVHDPETRRLLGVIDVTGGDPAASAQAQLLVDATARAVEGELLLSRLRERASGPRAAADGVEVDTPKPRRARPASASVVATLRVLGRDRALLETLSDGHLRVSELTTRHAEILLCLATRRQGVSAESLGELVYGDPDAGTTLRAEMVRLRKVLERIAPSLAPESRPYRLTVPLETDAHQLLSLLDRGAHRVALAAYRGDVLPDSAAPGVEEFRDTVRVTLREAMLAEASLDVLLAFADTDAGADDVEVLRLCLSMLPARSPKRAGLVARIDRLERVDP